MRGGFYLLAGGACLLSGLPALAQSSNPGIADIIVTARRTAERLQDVPVAVTGYNTAQLQNLGISGFGDIGRTVPNLDVQQQFGSASAPQYYLRGVSTGTLRFEADAGIGLYIDGVYLGRPAGTAFSLADIERVEVLRGPQGTLFGRNSTGGAINFITAKPSGSLGVRAEGTLGNFKRYKGRISIDLPAVGPLSARVSYLHDQHHGYVRNLAAGRTFTFAEPFGTIRAADRFGSENTDAVAVALRLDLGRFTADYKFDFTDKVSTQLAQQLLGFDPSYTAGVGNPPYYTAAPSLYLPPSSKRRDAVALDFTTPSRLKIQGHSLTLQYDASDTITLKSITGLRKLDEFVGGNDIDGGAYLVAHAGQHLPFTNISSLEDRHQKQVTQEVQLLGNSGPLEWIIGGFFFRETGRDNNPVFIGTLFPENTVIVPQLGTGNGNTINVFGVPSDYLSGANYRVRNRSLAGYAHLAYKTDSFELAGGVRYTKDSRQETLLAAGLRPFALPPATFDASNHHWDFDATATYIFNPRARAYLRFATGYLSGGVLGGVPFRPETMKSYEAGAKLDLIENTLRLNAALFHTNRHNVQTLSFTAEAGTFIISAPSARENGFELELAAQPTRHLSLHASYGYLSQKLADDPVLGHINSQAPRHTLSTGIQYAAPAFANDSHLQFNIDAFLKDKRLSDPVDTSTTILTTLPSRIDINARIALVDLPVGGTKVRLSGWVENLTNNQNLEFARNLTTTVIGTFQAPRSFGVDLGLQF